MTIPTIVKHTLGPFVLAALLVAPFASAEEAAEDASKRSPEALKILEKADAAIKKVEGVRFQSKVEPAGMATQFVAYAEGGGHMRGFNGQTPEKFYGKVVTSRPDSDEKVEIEGGGDGETYYLIDHSAKKGYEDMDPGVMGSTGRVLQNIGMIEYVHQAPFDDELGADTIELAGEAEVNGEPCWKIHVIYSGGRGESTWCFSKNDYLPRQRIRHISNPRGEGSITITMLEVEVDPEVDAGDYKMTLPEGYEQIDDFAP